MRLRRGRLRRGRPRQGGQAREAEANEAEAREAKAREAEAREAEAREAEAMLKVKFGLSATAAEWNPMERAHVLSASAASWLPSRGLSLEAGAAKGGLSALAADWHSARDQPSTGLSLSASAVPWLPAGSHNEAAEEGKGIPAMRLQKVRSCMSCHASTPLPLWVQALKCKKRRRRKEVAKAGLGQENEEEEAKSTSEMFSDRVARVAATVRLAINGAVLQLPIVKGAPLRRSVNIEGAVAVLTIVVEKRMLTKREMAYAAEKVVGLWTTELHVSAGRVEEKWARPNNSPVPFASDSAAVTDELNVSISCLSLHPRR